jgi:hypothetical protein
MVEPIAFFPDTPRTLSTFLSSVGLLRPVDEMVRDAAEHALFRWPGPVSVQKLTTYLLATCLDC